MTRPAGEVRLTLVSLPDCHLCEIAREQLGALAAEIGEQWREIDLTVDGAPQDEWWEQVPLVLVDGEPVCRWRVDQDALRERLRRRESDYPATEPGSYGARSAGGAGVN